MLPRPFPAALRALTMAAMITAHIQVQDDGVAVWVSRWERQGRYPAQLVDMRLRVVDGESELATIERACGAIAAEVHRRRAERD